MILNSISSFGEKRYTQSPQLSSSSKSIPGLQNQAGGAVFAVLPLFFLFQDAEGFAKEIGANFFMDEPVAFPLSSLINHITLIRPPRVNR